MDLPNQPAALKLAAWFQTICTCSPILCDSVLETASLFIHLSKSPLWSGGLPRPRPTKDPQRSSIGLIMAQTKMSTEGQPGCVRGSVPGQGGSPSGGLQCRWSVQTYAQITTQQRKEKTWGFTGCPVSVQSFICFHGFSHDYNPMGYFYPNITYEETDR